MSCVLALLSYGAALAASLAAFPKGAFGTQAFISSGILPRSQELARPLHAQPDPAEAEGGQRKLKALSRRQYTILNTDVMALSQMLTPREVQEAQTPWELRWQVLVGRMWNWFDEERAVNLALGMGGSDPCKG